MRNSYKAVALAVVALAFPSSAYCGLNGSISTGSLKFVSNSTNFFDPSNGFVPASYGNTSGTSVTISNAIVEFGFADSANTDTADFTDSTLSVADVATSSAGASSWQMVFTDPSFAGLNMTKINDTFSGSGISGSLVGNTITLNFAGVSGTFNSSAQFTLLPVPEPSMLALAGIAGVFGLMRRRRRAI